MFLIGLTGGFLTGKTYVSSFFRRKKIEVISLDAVYHRLLRSNTGLQKKLVAHFGKDICWKGKISRKRLREKVLSDVSFLKKLSSITHPYVIADLLEKISLYKKKKGFLIVEAPLLYEAKLARIFDKVIVVSASLQNQMLRAKRLGYSKRDAYALIKGQFPLARKKKRADYVINNNSSVKQLYASINGVFQDFDKYKN